VVLRRTRKRRIKRRRKVTMKNAIRKYRYLRETESKNALFVKKKP